MSHGRSKAQKSGTGALAATALIAAGSSARGTLHSIRRVERLILDPGLVGTAVQAEMQVDGAVIFRATAPVAGGAIDLPCLQDVSNRLAADQDIDLVVRTTAGTEEWFVHVEFCPA